MMILVLGGSGSGKSAYAETLACSLAEKEPMAKYYLAAMQVSDAEGERRAARHRALRDGKGFFTIEQPMQIEDALGRMQTGKRLALLECISNLTANEMFPETKIRPKEEVVKRVLTGISQIRQQTSHLIIVSNNVFEDGITYAPETMAYLAAMGEINRQLAAWADRVTEVVAGIPVSVKNGKN